jgi:hypothetical protein
MLSTICALCRLMVAHSVRADDYGGIGRWITGIIRRRGAPAVEIDGRDGVERCRSLDAALPPLHTFGPWSYRLGGHSMARLRTSS